MYAIRSYYDGLCPVVAPSHASTVLPSIMIWLDWSGSAKKAVWSMDLLFNTTSIPASARHLLSLPNAASVASPVQSYNFV